MLADRIKKLMAIAHRSREVALAVDEMEASLNEAIAEGDAKFVSGVLTGTGSAQNVAHGLGAIPSSVVVAVQDAAGAFSVVEGSHTSTNVVVTVTAGVTFKVLAFK